MRVLVTGHWGYIGPVMVRVLGEAGHDVVGLDTGYYLDCRTEAYEDAIPAIRKDTRDVTANDLAGLDAIVDLAALSNDPLGELDPEWTEEVNHRAPVRLARLARDAGVRRFLFSSSCSMYGAAGEDMVTEDAPLRPVSRYAEAKVRTEADLADLADGDFSPVFLRNGTAYGVSPRLRLDLVLNNLTAWAYTTGEVRITSDGRPWRPIVHVEDIARAFAAALAAPRDAVHNEAFNVGANTENYQVRDLAEIVQAVVPDSRVRYEGKSGPDPRSYRVDFGKVAERLPAFQPQWTAERGARELYEAFRRIGLTADALEDRRYIRLKQIEHLLEEDRLDRSLRWRDPSS